ncbi:SGNH/GDSL hydrolase family protein [Streptomyces sp. NPDC127098]|uniref:SGNH/GDSL hydrolase family protein n=1 Tax=Streptomyces sp. NPDC127098 TaxID=3347137 RepID=UPI00364CC26C
MASRRQLLAGALALAAAPTAIGATTAHAAAQPGAAAGVRVMPLGDSITDGFNVPGGYRIGLWDRLVAAGTTVDFVGSMSNGPSSLGDRDHEGHSGWTIAGIDGNVSRWLSTYAPQTILLHIGTNDIYGPDPGGAPNRLATLVNRITTQLPQSWLFLATITPLPAWDQTVRAFNATIPGLVQSQVNAGRRVRLVDMYAALTNADIADGVHPNATGYNKMAAAWYTALRAVPGSTGTAAAARTA